MTTTTVIDAGESTQEVAGTRASTELVTVPDTDILLVYVERQIHHHRGLDTEAQPAGANLVTVPWEETAPVSSFTCSATLPSTQGKGKGRI